MHLTFWEGSCTFVFLYPPHIRTEYRNTDMFLDARVFLVGSHNFKGLFEG